MPSPVFAGPRRASCLQAAGGMRVTSLRRRLKIVQWIGAGLRHGSSSRGTGR
ncbi:hypothetical protein ABIE67_000985 [Streptomyces sp. V4I8]|uniref:hypothetical protein n=1 Tax=Streptomyces sp. V4I8 TaxID=3156469 RepID=UPI0035180002